MYGSVPLLALSALVRQELEQRFAEDEVVQWIGKPEMFRTGWPGIGQVIMTTVILAIAAWLGFAYWMLVLFPLFMMWQAGRTDYVLTDQRAFVLREFKGGVFVRHGVSAT